MTKPKGSIPGVAAKREFGVDDFAKAKNYAVSEVVNDRLLFRRKLDTALSSYAP